MIGRRIKEYRISQGLKVAEFAKKIGISQGSLSNIENGISKPSSDTISSIVRNTDVDPMWLLVSEYEGTAQRAAEGVYYPDRHQMSETQRPDEKGVVGEFIHIPRYEVAASAGGGAVVNSEQVVDYLSFRSEWVRNTLGVSVMDLALISVIGDSMEPTLSEGDIVLLDMTTRSVLDGSIYALQLNGGLLVKRIQRKIDGSVVVKSDNARYDTETVSEDKADRLKIIGRVVWVGRRL